MKKYYDDALSLIKKASFTVPLLLTLLLGFGFTLTHFSVGIDDLTRERYISGHLFAQGRFSSTIVSYLFGFTDVVPFAEDFTAVVFLFFAAAVFCIVLKNASHGAFSDTLCTVFACLFASYPLINEIFIFSGASLNICIGYFLTGLSLLLAEKVLDSDGKKKLIPTVLNCLIWIFLISLYESFAFVYILCVCIVLLLKNLFDKTHKRMSVKECAIQIAVYAFPLIVGTIIEFILGKIIVSVFFGQSGSIYTGNSVDIGGILSPGTIVSSLYTIFRNHFLSGFWYLPIGIFAICVFISLITCIVLCVKRKNMLYVLFYAGMYFSLFALGILTQGNLKYRICQTYAVFTAFTILLLVHFITTKFDKPAIKNVVVALCGILVFFQASALTSYFADDYHRWEEEKNVLTTVAHEISSKNFNPEKPVIFIGEYTLSDDILDRKFVRSDSKGYKALEKIWGIFGGSIDNTDYDEVHVLLRAQGENGSLINFGIDAFKECNTDLLAVFKYLGYDFKQGDYTRYLELCDSQTEQPAFPANGYVTELEDCIVVNFG